MKRRRQLTEDNTDKSENNELTDNQETEVSCNNSSIEPRARQSPHVLRRTQSTIQSKDGKEGETNLGQPTHDDGQEETEKSRNGWR